MVEGTGLENRWTLTRSVGSNPTPSARGIRSHHRQKTEYGEVREGTKRHKMLGLLMSPKGLTGVEAINLGLINAESCLASTIESLRSDYGYSISRFDIKNPSAYKRKAEVVYKITARFNYDGSVKEEYVDFDLKSRKIKHGRVRARAKS